MSIFQNLIEIIEKKGSAYIVLIDPDKKNNDNIEDIVEKGNTSNVDAFFVGGSLIMDSKYENRVKSTDVVMNLGEIVDTFRHFRCNFIPGDMEIP